MKLFWQLFHPGVQCASNSPFRRCCYATAVDCAFVDVQIWFVYVTVVQLLWTLPSTSKCVMLIVATTFIFCPFVSASLSLVVTVLLMELMSYATLCIYLCIQGVSKLMDEFEQNIAVSLKHTSLQHALYDWVLSEMFQRWWDVLQVTRCCEVVWVGSCEVAWVGSWRNDVVRWRGSAADGMMLWGGVGRQLTEW